MNKKVVVMVSGIVAVGLGGLWINHSIKSAKEAIGNYLEFQDQPDSDIKQGYGILTAIGLRDMPGYAAAMNQPAASRYAKNMMENENAAFGRIGGDMFNVFLDGTLVDCAKSLHNMRVRDIRTLSRYSNQTLIKVTDLEEALKASNETFLKYAECVVAYKDKKTEPTEKAEMANLSHNVPASNMAPEQPVEIDWGQGRNQNMQKLRVVCPDQYTNKSINEFYINQFNDDFSQEGQDNFEAKKAPLWMDNAFPYTPDPNEKPYKWESCISYQGYTFAWASYCQPHNCPRDSVALVDLQKKYAAILTIDRDTGESIITTTGNEMNAVKMGEEIGFW